ncbi:MAG: nitrate reductase cytochrome c-type subunit, partial [Shewanella sp.]|nr:nitrate reductase cytochrome c-type subunit [Shewanella sp.]
TFLHRPTLIPHRAKYPINLKKNSGMNCHMQI